MKRSLLKKVLVVLSFVLILGAMNVNAEEAGNGGQGSEQTPNTGDGQGGGQGSEQTPDTGGEQGGGQGSEQTPGTGGEQGGGQGSEQTPGTGGEQTTPGAEDDAGGTATWQKACGPNVTAAFANGVLTVSGSGPMANYSETVPSVFSEIKGNIYKIVIENGVTAIGDYAFVDTKCNVVEIGPSVTTIGMRAFYGSKNLNTVTIPANVVEIKQGAFRDCSSLIECKLSEGLKIIRKYAFYQTALKSIKIPESTTSIGKRAFVGTALTAVEIPAGVQMIYEKAFEKLKITAMIYGEKTAFGPSAFTSGATLGVRTNSTAEAFAKANGLDMIYLDCITEGGFPAPHSWDSGKITKASTCKEKGVKTYTCTKCGATKTEDVALTAHSYGPWTQTVAPTVFAKGSQRRTCSVCSYTETKSVKKATPVLVLNTKKLTLGAGGSYKLAVVSKGAGDSVKSWASSNKKVATVGAAGKVKAKTPGTAKVTVTLKSGLSATVKVTVTKVSTTSITVTKAKGAKLKNKKVSVKAGKSFWLVAKVTPSNSSDKVTFSSSKKSVATVNASGKVTARRKGTAKITVKSGNKKVKITVKVK